MNEWYEQAKSKLEAEKKAGSYDRYANAMKDAVCEAGRTGSLPRRLSRAAPLRTA